jgi:hypothetical protein
MSAPVLCTVGAEIIFYIESHWIHHNTWKTFVSCLVSGGGINAFRMASSNASPVEKSCVCAYIAFLAGIFSWYATVLDYVYILDCVVGNINVTIGLTLHLHKYKLQNSLHFFPFKNEIILFNSMKFCKRRWMTFVTHAEDLRRKWQDNIKIDVIEIVCLDISQW